MKTRPAEKTGGPVITNSTTCCVYSYVVEYFQAVAEPRCTCSSNIIVTCTQYPWGNIETGKFGQGLCVHQFKLERIFTICLLFWYSN